MIADPWVTLLEDRLNFRFGFDRTSRYAYFTNQSPVAGEPAVFRTNADVSYCDVAFLPNLNRTGHLLLIAGAEVEGTEGGGEFVTSERSLSQFRTLAKLEGAAQWPYFEVLLISRKIGGSTPGFTPVAYRLVRP